MQYSIITYLGIKQQSMRDCHFLFFSQKCTASSTVHVCSFTVSKMWWMDCCMLSRFTDTTIPLLQITFLLKYKKCFGSYLIHNTSQFLVKLANDKRVWEARNLICQIRIVLRIVVVMHENVCRVFPFSYYVRWDQIDDLKLAASQYSDENTSWNVFKRNKGCNLWTQRSSNDLKSDKVL